MIIFEQDLQIVVQDSVSQNPDTSVQKLTVTSDSVRVIDSLLPEKVIDLPEKSVPEPADTTSLCIRNSISDVTFYDSSNLVTRIDQKLTNRFPAVFIEKNRFRERETMETLLINLKNGEEIPQRLFHADWITILILFSAFFYALVSTFPKRITNEARRFFLFRDSANNSSGDTGELFHWQSTIFNLVSFLNLSLFVYSALSYYDLIPSTIREFTFWLILLLILVSSVTIRHIICYITGEISGERLAFSEYIITIYQFYRFLAFILFLITILLSYTAYLPVKSLFISGFIVVSCLYLFRLIKLFYIFLNRNISILYLILYLCALEFLPVVVLIKYLTGLL